MRIFGSTSNSSILVKFPFVPTLPKRLGDDLFAARTPRRGMHFYPQPSLLVFATGMYSSLGRQTRYIRSLQAAYWLPNSLLSAAVRDGHQRAQFGHPSK